MTFAQTQSAFEDRGDTEQLGEIQLADFLVEPSVYFTERGTLTGAEESGFSLGNTYFAAKWKMQRYFSGRLQLASYDLLNRPSWSPVTESGIGFVEAYAQLDSTHGRIRAGLIPLMFGLDGSTEETKLWFQRSAIYTQRRLGLRDLGISYNISHNGFFTDLAVHNGEGGRDYDRRFWHTARWGWNGPAGITVGMSGSVGFYKPQSTQEDTKVRIGNVFAGMELYAIGFAAEGTVGEEKSKLTKTQFVNAYAQLRHNIGRLWGLLARYEYYDPSNIISGDSTKQGALGFYVKNETNTSRLSFLFLKNWEESFQTANDEYWLTWKITSAYLN